MTKRKKLQDYFDEYITSCQSNPASVLKQEMRWTEGDKICASGTLEELSQYVDYVTFNSICDGNCDEFTEQINNPDVLLAVKQMHSCLSSCSLGNIAYVALHHPNSETRCKATKLFYEMQNMAKLCMSDAPPLMAKKSYISNRLHKMFSVSFMLIIAIMSIFWLFNMSKKN